MTYEYRSTVGTIRTNVVKTWFEVDDPVEPDGDNWELVCSTSQESCIIWSWRRPTPQKEY